MIEIGILDENDSLTEVDLDNEVFFLQHSWNDYAQHWTLSIENAYNEQIIAGVKVVPNHPVLHFYTMATLPAGQLVYVVNGSGDTIGRDAFKKGNATLCYFTAQEVAGVVNGSVST